MVDEESLKQKIFEATKLYLSKKIREEKISGKDYLNYAGAVYNYKEIIAIFNSVLDGWFGLGKKAKQFQQSFADYHNINHALVTNSGSSANLIAISLFCSKELDNCCKSGDEVITPASTFPTTLNPILQNNLVPVFLDVELGTYNIDTNMIEDSIGPKTKGIFVPHILGNPNEMTKIKAIAQERDLFVIEDCCDALGTKYRNRIVGTWGDVGTFSFYAAHHMTMGEGGALITNNSKLKRIAQSIRDWGRACYCDFDEKNPNGACDKRFEFELEGIKIDHRYLYSNIGYNLKPLELQCAMALEQLEKLPKFISKRKRNFKIIHNELSTLENYFILPRSPTSSDVSWFAFPLTILPDTGIRRNDLMKYLEQNKIQTRVLFSGNILKHPAYKDIKYRKIGDLEHSNTVLRDTFFVGVYPGLSEENMKYIAQKIKDFVKN